MSDEFLTVAEIAVTLKLNQQTVRNWIDRAGCLPIGLAAPWCRVRVGRADFERLLTDGLDLAATSKMGTTPKRREPEQTIWDGSVPRPVRSL